MCNRFGRNLCTVRAIGGKKSKKLSFFGARFFFYWIFRELEADSWKIKLAYPERTFLGIHEQKFFSAYMEPFSPQPLYGVTEWRAKLGVLFSRTQEKLTSLFFNEKRLFKRQNEGNLERSWSCSRKIVVSHSPRPPRQHISPGRGVVKPVSTLLPDIETSFQKQNAYKINCV